MTSLLDTITATINHYKHLLTHNAVLAQQAHDWQSSCTIHHMPRFRDILKVQEGKPEQECWTCSSCEIERRRAALAQPKPKLNHSPGFMLLAVNAQEREYKQELIHRIAANRISTSPLAARDIQYASTPPIDALEDDPDATEMRPAIKLHKATTTNTTQEIPAITAEITLLEIMRGPTSPHDTGEQAPVKISEDAFLL